MSTNRSLLATVVRLQVKKFVKKFVKQGHQSNNKFYVIYKLGPFMTESWFLEAPLVQQADSELINWYMNFELRWIRVQGGCQAAATRQHYGNSMLTVFTQNFKHLIKLVSLV